MFLVQGRVPGLWLWPGAKQVLVRLSQSLHLMSRCQWPVTTPWARIRAVSGGWVMCHGWCFRRIFLHASISTFLLLMRGFASVSMPTPLSVLLPIIWSILENCLSSYIRECWHNLSSDSLDAGRLLFMMKYLHLWPVASDCSEWLDNVSDSGGLTSRLSSLSEVTHGACPPFHQQPPLAGVWWNVGWYWRRSLPWDTNMIRAGPHGFLGKQIIVPELSRCIKLRLRKIVFLDRVVFLHSWNKPLPTFGFDN